MTEHRLTEYLDHLHEAASQVGGYLEGMNKEAFLADRRTQQAVILNLIILGEAATKLLQRFAPFLDTHPDVPWQSMKGMRNRIAHGYFDIDLDVVWQRRNWRYPNCLTGCQLSGVKRMN